jgi:hypothetical protein
MGQSVPSPIVREDVELAPALAPAASVVRIDAAAWAATRANDAQRWQGVPIAPGRNVDLTLTRVKPNTSQFSPRMNLTPSRHVGGLALSPSPNAA